MDKGTKVGEHGQIWNPGGGCKNIRHLAKVSRREGAMALGGVGGRENLSPSPCTCPCRDSVLSD